MKLALHAGFLGPGASPAQQLRLVAEAERLDYDSAWTAEAYGSDAATLLAWLAAQTRTIRLGAGVLQMPARSAAMTAMTAATIDQLSGGRMILGLGSSGPQVSEGWHGQPFSNQLARTREYVAVVRMALARQRVQLAGETLTLPLPGGPGKALKLTIAPVQERLPIYLAAIGPRNTELAGEIADGWLPTLLSPEHGGELRAALARGAARAGRDVAEIDVAAHVYARVDDDRDAARDALRPLLALYVGGMGSRRRNFYNRLVAGYGFEDAARLVQELYLGGRHVDAMAALPAALIDAVSLSGPPDVVRSRIEAFRAAGVTTLCVSPIGADDDARCEQLRLIARLAG